VPYKDPVQRRDYNRRYQKLYYEENKTKRRSEVANRRKDIRKWFDDFRRNSECAVCGLNGKDCPWLLDFHHTDPANKENSISYLVNNGYSKKRILSEIEKCEVLCANHHRQHHWEKRRNKLSSNPPPVADLSDTSEKTRAGKDGQPIDENSEWVDRGPDKRRASSDRKNRRRVNRARASARLPKGQRLPGPKPKNEEE
jgi:hypothetical protein